MPAPSDFKDASVDALDEAAAQPAADDAKPRKGVGALVVSGTFWLLLQTLGSKLVMLGGQLALAWLLSPEDFGEIAMAYAVLAFVALLINPGIDVILVRRGRRFHLWSTPAFYFSLIAGLIGCAVMLAVSPVVAHLFHSPRLIGLLTVLALATPIGSLMLVPTAKLRAEMRFGAISLINLLQTTLQTALTLTFALANFGVYSFVLPMPIVYALMSIVLWTVARPTLRAHHPLQYWRHLIGDTSYIFGQRLLITTVTQGDYIVLGLLFGAEVVGPYFFAYGIAVQAIRLTAGPMQLVLMAGLTRFDNRSLQQTQAALRVTKSLVLFGMPLCMLQAVVARPLLIGMYGDKWLAAVPLVQLISIGMAFDVATWPACSLLQSRGQFRTLFLWSSFLAPMFFVFVIGGAYAGESLGVAYALAAYYVLLGPVLVGWVFHNSGVEWSQIGAIYTRPIVVGLLTAGAALLAIRFTSSFHPFLLGGFAAIAGLIIMGFSASFFAADTWSEIMVRLMGLVPPQILPRRRVEN